jgi:hypothetical protein
MVCACMRDRRAAVFSMLSMVLDTYLVENHKISLKKAKTVLGSHWTNRFGA